MIRDQMPANRITTADSARQIGSDMQVGISSFGSWMLGVGSIIGSMAWLFHGPMIARAGTGASILAWIIAGCFTLPLALILMELSSMFPAAGGPYVYKYYALKRLVPQAGELFGFLTGWLFWIMMLVALACVSNGLVNLLSSSIWRSTNASPLWFGPAVILLFLGSTTALNLMQVQSATQLNIAFTLLKFAMAVSFGCLVLASPSSSMANVLQTSNPAGDSNLLRNVSSVLMLALSGFIGIELGGCAASETINAKKNVPKALLMTLMAVIAIQAGMCLAVGAAAHYELDGTKTTMLVTGTNIQATCPSLTGYLMGSPWGTIFTACVVMSIVGCGFVILLATARVGYSIAKTGLFPAPFATLDPRTKVPRYALLFQLGCICSISIAANLLARSGVVPDAYTFLAETFGFMYAFIAILYGISAVSLRYTDPNLDRPHRIGKNGNGLLWALASFTILIWGYAAFGCVRWTHQVAGGLILLAGIPVYSYYSRRQVTPFKSPAGDNVD